MPYTPVYSFLITRQPPTFNSWKDKNKWPEERKQQYISEIKRSISLYNPNYKALTGNLYMKVFHFFNKDARIDADNITKPMLDVLKGILYLDDYQVKDRRAVSHNLTQNGLTTLTLSDLPSAIVGMDLLEASEKEDHILFVEIGSYNPLKLKF